MAKVCSLTEMCSPRTAGRRISLFKRLLCVAAACSLCLASCGEQEGPAERTPISFSSVNERGNTNGNIANMGMGVSQGEWIIFTHMEDGGLLKASKNGGRHCFSLMSGLNDIFACINLTGYRLDYISSVYGDINTAMIDDETASALISGTSYCIQTVGGYVYYIDESGDGGVYRFDTESGKSERIGSHAAYDENVTSESSHASFSIDDGYLYYCAADDGSRIYRVELESGAESLIGDVSADMLIADGGSIFFVGSDDRCLYSLSDDGNFKRLTQCAVGTFNFDGRYLFYTDADAAGSPVMRMSRSGSGAVKLCDVTDTMYITLLGDVVMLYCVSDGGSVSTVFVDRGSGDTYSPG